MIDHGQIISDGTCERLIETNTMFRELLKHQQADEDRNGISPVDEYLRELDGQNSKDARIRREKIRTYVKILKERGLPLPEPLCKHMVDKIYELRPVGDRVFFAGWIDGAYVLLHCYRKQGQKTPPRDLKKAQEEFADFVERWEKNGKD